MARQGRCDAGFAPLWGRFVVVQECERVVESRKCLRGARMRRRTRGNAYQPRHHPTVLTRTHSDASGGPCFCHSGTVVPRALSPFRVSAGCGRSLSRTAPGWLVVPDQVAVGSHMYHGSCRRSRLRSPSPLRHGCLACPTCSQKLCGASVAGVACLAVRVLGSRYTRSLKLERKRRNGGEPISRAH